jgi:hypothetical protein
MDGQSTGNVCTPAPVNQFEAQCDTDLSTELGLVMLNYGKQKMMFVTAEKQSENGG